jgi:hypothetical protein
MKMHQGRSKQNPPPDSKCLDADDGLSKSSVRPSAEVPDQDFLLTRTPVSRIQFIGLLILGLNLIVGSTTIWVIYVSESIGLKDGLDAGILVSGSAVCGFLCYLGYLHIRRAFTRNAEQKGTVQKVERQ